MVPTASSAETPACTRTICFWTTASTAAAWSPAARNRIAGWQGVGIQFDYDRAQVTLDTNSVGITPGGWTVNYRVPPKQGIVSTNNAWAVKRSSQLSGELASARWISASPPAPG